MILGSWSGVRKYLEQEMLAESLRKRIRYNCTTFKSMDDWKVFEIYVDNKLIKRFSLETVNTFFITNGYKEISNPFGKTEYWEQFWKLLNEVPITERTEYTDEEFCDALKTYRNQDITESIHSDNPIIVMFAIIDRRIGKRTLNNIKTQIDHHPQWIRDLYILRTEAENII